MKTCLTTVKKPILLSILFVLFIFKINAQITFERTYGEVMDDDGRSIQQTSNGGFVIVGNTNNLVYLIQTNINGDTIWTKTFGGSNSNTGHSVRQTIDDGFIIAGETNSFNSGNFDVYLIRTDINGDTIWTRTYGGASDDYGYSVCQTFDSGFVVAGYTRSFGAGYDDFYVLRIDANGDTLWTKTYGGADWDDAYSIQQTNDYGFIIVGWTKSYGAGDADVYLIRTDGNGDTLWTKTFGGIDWDGASCVQLTDDGGYLIVGSGLIKTNSNGDTLWTRKLSGGFGLQTNDGGYIITGSKVSGTGLQYYDAYLIRTDSNGDTLWTKKYGGTNYDIGNSVQQINDGGFIIVGTTLSFGAGGADIYLIKTDSNGNVLTGINEPTFNNQPLVKISPNPFSTTATLQIYNLQSAISNLQFRMYDVLGREVFQSAISNSQFTISRQGLPSGIYFYKIAARGYETIANGKVVIE